MMERHPRKPALFVLLLTVLIGGAYLITWKSLQAARADGNTVEALEKRIADEKAANKGAVAANTWQSYGDALMKAGDHKRASIAYQEVLQLDPRNRTARFQRGLAL